MEEVLEYRLPTIDLLIKDNETEKINIDEEKEKIEKFFNSYNIDIDCKDIYKGINSVTYVIDIKMKNTVKTIEGFTPEIKMFFNPVDVNYEKAINRTTYLGIQMIYEKRENLILGNLIESNEFINTDKKIPLIIGTDLNGKNIIEDLAVLPHLLIAGTTGVGKSILLSTFIVDMLYKFNPDEMKLVLIDTRKNNFLRFEGLPHLLTPIITDSKKSIRVISRLIEIMSERYKLFNVENVDNIDNYNEVADVKLPRIVVIIEDFCDLMLDTSSEIEEYIVRLAQMSRAAGIHLIISNQRPSTNVLTGVIKSNLPARIAFNVPSQVDSKTIIDVANAEKLLLYGDILYRKPGVTKLKRIQTPYISDGEINNILNYIKENNSSVIANMNIEVDIEEDKKEIYEKENEKDPLLEDAIEYITEIG